MARPAAPKVSLIVPTFGRVWQLGRLFDSLEAQSLRDFELIISDQNPPGFLDLAPLIARVSFPVRHIVNPTERGISRARNAGLAVARGEVIVFPDDDAWYPQGFLERGVTQLERLGADIVTGRSIDTAGRTINGRFAKTSQAITRGGVWIMQIEWATFYRKAAIQGLGGFDETIGIGASSPWQAAEGPDLLLRALASGLRCHYDVDLVGYHEEYETRPPSRMMTAKAHAYARGMGYVLRKNGIGLPTALYWGARPLFQLLVGLLHGDFKRARYFLLVSIGRLEGWAQTPLTMRLSASFSGREAMSDD